MKKIITIIIITALLICGYIYRFEVKNFVENIMDKFSGEDSAIKPEKIPRNQVAKKVDVFNIRDSKSNFSLSKTGLVRSSNKITITPQISGKIISSNFKIGDQVKRGQTLFTIGNSLNTDLLEIQNRASTENYELAQQLLDLVNYTGRYNNFNAGIGSKIAENNSQVLENTADSSEEILEDQLQLAEITLENAEIAYDNSKENYEDLLDSLEETEDNDQLSPKDREAQIEELEIQIDNAEAAKKISKNSLEQAEVALNQLETSNEQQLDQLDATIANSQLQYQIALNQLESTNVGNQIQVLNTLAQMLQSQRALESSEANLDQLTIRSPIDGVVSSKDVEKDNLVGPGQSLMTIENPENITIETSINQKELLLLIPSPKITIKTDSEEVEASILSISPILQENTQKISIELTPSRGIKILPGDTVKINFQIAKSPLHIFIPLNSVFLEDEKKIVKVIGENNIVINQEVTLGEIIDKFVEIRSGLTGREKIIANQLIFLSAGEKVKEDIKR